MVWAYRPSPLRAGYYLSSTEEVSKSTTIMESDLRIHPANQWKKFAGHPKLAYALVAHGASDAYQARRQSGHVPFDAVVAAV